MDIASKQKKKREEKREEKKFPERKSRNGKVNNMNLII